MSNEHRCSRVAVAWALGALLAVPGLARSAAAADPAARTVLVFAAASTTDAVEELQALFQRQHPDVKLKASFAASSTLAKQIAAGAGADVFLSANREWADYLEKEKLVAQRHELLANRLVMIVPADSPLRIAGPQGLLDAGVRRLALADPDSVPAGIYARQALTRLDLWDKLKGKVVSGADVRHALEFVETGAAEAGIVYATDAAASKRVRVVASIDPKLSEPIVYPLVLLRKTAGAPPSAAAEQCYKLLQSQEAATVFRKFGFEVPANKSNE